MKRPGPLSPLLHAAAAAALCVMLASCTRDAGGVVRVVPQPLGDASTAVGPGGGAERVDSSAPRPKIAVDPASTILQIVNVNLDQDADEEQVIALKRMNDVSSPVRIIVVDGDPASGTYYFQSWETDTDATDNRVFTLSVRDIIGDHGLQIIASGMNEAGRLTLDVYKLLPPSPGKGIRYKPVCQLVADEVSIDESERPDGYSTDPRPGASFPIVAYLRDPDSPNVMDLVRIRYSWNAAEARYVPGAAEKIPGEEVQQAQLRGLFTSSGEQAFEQFISGSWVQIQPPPSGKGRDTYSSIIDFDPLGRKISLASGNTQEAYIWRESHRTIYNTLRVVGENETVLQIRLIRSFSITVNDPNTITVTVSSNDSADSSTVNYTKVNEDIGQRLMLRPDSQVALSPLTLTGKYSASKGLTVDFRYPRITWTDGTGPREGTYVLFSLGTGTILTTRLRANPRGREENRSWLVDYREKKTPVSVSRTLSLSPVVLTVNGYEEANGDGLSLLQEQDLKR